MQQQSSESSTQDSATTSPDPVPHAKAPSRTLMSLEQAVDSLTWKCIHCTVKGYERLIPLSVIAQAHQSDCFYCRTLRGALDVLEPGWERSCAEESMTLRFSWGGDLPSFTPSKGASTVYLYISLCHEFTPAPISMPDWWRISPLTTVISDSGSRAAYTRIRSWIRNCVQNHPNCVQGDSGPMPRRIIDLGDTIDEMETAYLLDLGTSDGSGTDAAGTPDSQASAALRVSPEPYAALSYCWGSGEQSHKTTKANVRQRRSGFAVSLLPKSIRDAMSVCRGLDIRYIWIDALCIVQDDEPDWQRESVRMLDVYANSHITIAAHTAASSHDGFLGAQLYGHQPSCQSSFQIEVDESKYLEFFLSIGTGTGKAWGPSPLMKRGWTLQEAILPRRIVHFTGKEMFWECEEGATCECSHISHQKVAVGNGQRWLAKQSFCGFSAATDKQWSGLLTREGWMEIVNMYSSRELSKWSDRFVAIAGLAQLVRRSSGVTKSNEATDEPCYLAGMFRDQLPRHLLWCTVIPKNSKERTSRGSAPCAPSWSWASLIGPTEYSAFLFGVEETSHVVMHGAETYCPPFSAVQHTGELILGKLTIEGSVVPVRIGPWIRGTSEHLAVVQSPANVRSEIIIDDIQRHKRTISDDKECWKVGPIAGHKCDKCDPSTVKWDEERFLCLKVATYMLPDTGKRRLVDSTSTHFLVLESVGADQILWRRFGVGSFDPSLDDEGVMEIEQRLFDNAEQRKVVII